MLKWIIILATVLRLFWLDKVPPSLNWDEVSMGYTAYSVSQTGRDEWGEKLPLLFRSYGEWKSAVYIYVLVPFIKVFGLNAWAVRLPSAIAGILAVYLTYLIGRRLYSDKVGLWAAFFLAVSPWHVLLSRPAFEANVSLTLILAGLYYFLRSSTNYDLRSTILSALFFGLAPHTYNSAKVVVPFLAIYLIWQSKLYKNLKYLLVFLGMLSLFALPLTKDLFSGRAQFRYSQVGVSTDSFGLNEFVNLRNNQSVPPLLAKLAFNKYTFSLHTMVSNGLSYLNPSFLLVEAGNHTQHHVPYFGVLYLAEFIFMILGMYYLRSHSKHSLRYLPFVLIALGIVPAALTRDLGHVLRSILTLPGWQLLAAIGVVELQNMKYKYLKFAYALLLLQIVVFLIAYFAWYPKAYARDWQYGLKEAAAYVKEHESEYDHIVVSKWFGETQLFLAFYNQWDPTWYMQENKHNLEYERQGKLWLDQLEEYSLGKYTFKYIKYGEPESGKTLYVGKFDDFYENPNSLKTIRYPDGTVAVYIVEGGEK